MYFYHIIFPSVSAFVQPEDGPEEPKRVPKEQYNNKKCARHNVTPAFTQIDNRIQQTWPTDTLINVPERVKDFRLY